MAKLQKALGTVDDDVSMAAQLEAWRDNPFDPHLIARMRPLAYQKATVMAYIQNLIEWGDKLFRQDSMESINEATQIYLMAQGLLGPRPVFIDDPVDTPAKTYEELQAVMGDESNNFFIQGESLIWDEDATLVESTNPPPGPVLIPYFCFPPNEKLLGYWDIVEDRLFKIRHCMNIEGRVRELAKGSRPSSARERSPMSGGATTRRFPASAPRSRNPRGRRGRPSPSTRLRKSTA